MVRLYTRLNKMQACSGAVKERGDEWYHIMWFGLHFPVSPQTREVATRCSTGCCWTALSSRWSCRTTKITTPMSHHWRTLTWRTSSGCESCNLTSKEWRNRPPAACCLLNIQYECSVWWEVQSHMISSVIRDVLRFKWNKQPLIFNHVLLYWHDIVKSMSSSLQAGQWKWGQTMERTGRENEKRYGQIQRC